ncbi:Myb/SANT-like DNA-binding domain protein [Medicago truncatula]|uniref:Myb/SANT-like DNA-binding domain protein n=1 Tax=Medicago truncatula TaxID=3880 RepID=A0A072UU02_MEDTR|nr:Myb/SANT-like DNA-binding domain protein [Medicago truncatula]
MASNGENMDGGMTFKWTENDHEKIFSELCIKFIRKNGRVSFRWKEINQEFESIIKRKCVDKTLKNKYDYMKKDWRLWKFLKFGETGLGWDPLTGKLSCSDEWWDRKIKMQTLETNYEFLFNHA